MREKRRCGEVREEGRRVGCVVKEEGGSERGREKGWGCKKTQKDKMVIC